MTNRFGSLKYLPWALLFQSAAVTIAIAVVLDFLLLQGLTLIIQQAPQLVTKLPRLMLRYTGLLAPLAAAYGIGALAILITTRFFREIRLAANIIWALVGALALLLWASTFLPVPGLLRMANTATVVSMALGAFFSSKRYWR
ncbi:MAG: hypothetical protein AAFN12_04115 [Cyanobacteria bacterium J06560_2]